MICWLKNSIRPAYYWIKTEFYPKENMVMQATIYVRLKWEEKFHEYKEGIQSALFECGCYNFGYGWFTSNGINIEGYGEGNWFFTRVGITRANIDLFESKFKSHPALARCSYIYRDED